MPASLPSRAPILTTKMRARFLVCSSGVWKYRLVTSLNRTQQFTAVYRPLAFNTRQSSPLLGIGFCSFNSKHASQIPAFQPSRQPHILVRRTIQCTAEDQRRHSDTESGDSLRAINKSRVVFLGSPEVAAIVLGRLMDASASPDSIFEISAVVSQPPSSRGRGRRKQELQPTAVAQLAMDRGIDPHRILCPVKANEPAFLDALRGLQPDLCITAAYGNFLPTPFLSIPKRGTVNIHPSLLPLFRGASPVQRALEEGVEHTGVSVAYTVLQMDAGPIIASETVPVDPHVQAPQLLEDLFQRGTKLLLSHLPAILDGSAASYASPQDGSTATHASKVSSEEGILSFSEAALSLHNKVRAFAGWPGTRASFTIVDPSTGEQEPLDVKILRTRFTPRPHAVTPGSTAADVAPAEIGPPSIASSPANEVVPARIATATLPQTHVSSLPTTLTPTARTCQLAGDALIVPCDDGSALEILELQPISKKAMTPKAFWNGLRGRKLLRS